MPDDLKPKHDKFTAKVVSDPAKPQNTLLLQGFLGASSQPDYTRVYADLSLDSYVDVANADIIHIEPVPPAQSPMGGSYLWVKKDADVFPGTGTSSASAKAKFLTGAITAEAAASVQPAAPVQPLPITNPVVACHPTIVVKACPTTTFEFCPTRLCPVTIPPQCFPQTSICPTRLAVCVGATGFACVIPDPTIQQQTPQAQFAGAQAAQPQLVQPVSLLPEAACVTTAVAICVTRVGCPTPVNQCPSIGGFHCASVNNFQCPSVAGFECPTVNSFHCPSVAGFQCPSVASFQCPSVDNFHCPVTVSGVGCPVSHACTGTLPQAQLVCPRPTLDCPTNASIRC